MTIHVQIVFNGRTKVPGVQNKRIIMIMLKANILFVV